MPMAKDPKVLEAALRQVRAARSKADPQVLETAERLVRHQMGMPQKPSLAVAMLEQAQANGGRNRQKVLSELERYCRQRGIDTSGKA
ncbi:hypothetical protein [Oceanibaculum sp.]|uniref:Uncharacterized protein n=2 Tax=Oceanibaculum indicum TaxID=526216 RepID=K2J2Y4_9PROT|nr:hypothetical protein [Oceanibaculum sp.]EKE77376.1 hypothetical protein P24_06327 [Oceanibaculum indicum P24]MCH2395354.1 hypothetical protein [Oceanibaculum sp.]